MGVLIVLSLIVVVGIIMLVSSHNSYDAVEFVGALLVMVAGVSLLVVLITIPLSRMNNNVFIQQVQETSRTYKSARATGNNMESAAIQIDIAKLNRSLVKRKYYNANYFDIWCPDEIEELQPIK